jgi:3-methyl-2-oxobutanoate hydroxymethyltransferase
MEGTLSKQSPLPALQEDRKKTTLLSLRQKKQRREALTMLTAYDYPTAMILDRSGLDVILVGDSLGMVVLGYENTLPVTMEDMLHHCRAVARGAHSAMLVGDMPFLSYQVSVEQAVRNAGRFLQEGGMDAVKLEGGRERRETVQAIVQAGIPVMGHLGLTPQAVHQLGGFRVQGRSSSAALRLLEDAVLLEQAGCFSLVLESIPARLAGLISQRISIPVFGIGAGVGCDGQVLVLHDLLGFFDRFTPKFVRRYANINEEIQQAVGRYLEEVRTRQFPAQEHSVEMEEEEWSSLLAGIGEQATQ